MDSFFNPVSSVIFPLIVPFALISSRFTAAVSPGCPVILNELFIATLVFSAVSI